MTSTRGELSGARPEKLDAETLQRRLHLWFFRDLSEAQRLGLFRLCGYPIEEMSQHSIQQHCLKHLVGNLTDAGRRAIQEATK